MTKQINNQNQGEQAQAIALQGLTFLLSEPNRIARFMSETGFTPDFIREHTGSTDLLEAALGALLDDEAALLTFAANAGIQPDDVIRAHGVLTAGNGGRQPLNSI
jgi:Protein of unknown function (DUF3572)